MNDQDFDDFVNAIGTLAELYDKKLSPSLLKMYFQALSQFDIVQFQAAVGNAMMTMKFFPKPVELIELITGGPSSTADTAEVEFAKVVDAVRKHGAYQTVRFDDPVTTAVILRGFGGWVKICDDMTEDQTKWFRKDFVRMYTAFKNQGVVLRENLIGIHDAQNQVAGYLSEKQAPLAIGDQRNFKLICGGITK